MASKFRFAKVEPAKRDQSFTNIKLFDTSPTSTSIACSRSFVATPSLSAGRLIVLPRDIQKYDAKNVPPLVVAHAGSVGDFQFSPYNPNLLATGGDEVVRLWKIPPNGLKEDLTTPELEMGEMSGGVLSLAFNPLVDSLLAAACKSMLKICDVSSGTSLFEYAVSGFGKDLINVSWDYFGKSVACVSKDSSMLALDPRSYSESKLIGTKTSGFRPQSCHFMGPSGRVVVAGVDSRRQPVLHCYDPRELSSPLFEQDLELSPGKVMPFYDVDTRVLALAMRGSSVVRLYDCTKAVKRGEFRLLSQKMLPSTIDGACMAPKYSVSVKESEIIRLYGRSENTVLPISIKVPRKIQGFHSELYPDSLSDAPSGVSPVEWKGGKNAEVKLLSIDENLSNFKHTQPGKKSEQKEDQKTTTTENDDNTAADAKKRRDSIVLSEATKKITCKLKRSAFVHLSGEMSNSTGTYYSGIQTDRPVIMHRNLEQNRDFLAFPWKSTGGSALAILRKGSPYRRLTDIKKVRGHSDQVTAFALSRLTINLLASGSSDGLVKIWNLPEGDDMKQDLKQAVATLECSGKILGVRFHPLVSDVLVTYSMGYGVCHMRFWDLKKPEQERILIEAHGESEIMDVSFNHNGSLIATTAKDKKCRIIDPRQNKVISELKIEEAQRDTHVYFLDSTDETVACVGFCKGQRQIGIYETKTGKQLAYVEVEGDSGSMLPHYDIDTGLLYVAGVGAPSVQFFLLDTKEPYIEVLQRYKCTDDFKGFSMSEKLECDVKKVEVAKGWLLSKTKLAAVSFELPRKRREFFQDDIFVPTASANPMMGSGDWFSGDKTSKEKEVVTYVSLQPQGMTPLSEAPKEELTERQIRYRQNKKAMQAPKAKGCLGHESAQEVREHFQNLADMMETTTNQWDAGEAQEDSDWSD